MRARIRTGGMVGVAVAALVLSSCISFGQPTEYRLRPGEDTRVTDMVWADVTGDGTDDLIALTSDSTLVRLEPCGPGCLVPKESFAVGYGLPTLSLTDADFDGDGTDDVVVKGFVMQIFFGSAGGATRPPGLVATDVAEIRQGSSPPIAADLDDDGDADLGVLYTTGPGIPVPTPLAYGIFPGDGHGGFGPLVPVRTGLFHDRSFNSKLTLGDIDGDGTPEAIAYGQSYDNGEIGDPTVIAMSADGGVVAEWHDPSAGYLPNAAVGDLDGDGLDDLAVVAGYGPSLQVGTQLRMLRSTGTDLVPFTAPVLTPHTVVERVAIEDVDADGHPEVLITPGYEYQQPGWLSWWRGTAAGIPAGAQRVDRQLPTSVGLIAFGRTTAAAPALALGQPGGSFAALYALPNTSA